VSSTVLFFLTDWHSDKPPPAGRERLTVAPRFGPSLAALTLSGPLP
jgi:hypothetical protein